MSKALPDGFQLHALENVQPLRPIRVLLVGRDARYLRAIDFLLSRRGYETRRVPRPVRLLDDVGAFSADVVILDGGKSFTTAAREAAMLLAMTDRVGVVIASSRRGSSDTARLHFVEKWSSFDPLIEAVELAWGELSTV